MDAVRRRALHASFLCFGLVCYTPRSLSLTFVRVYSTCTVCYWRILAKRTREEIVECHEKEISRAQRQFTDRHLPFAIKLPNGQTTNSKQASRTTRTIRVYAHTCV